MSGIGPSTQIDFPCAFFQSLHISCVRNTCITKMIKFVVYAGLIWTIGASCLTLVFSSPNLKSLREKLLFNKTVMNHGSHTVFVLSFVSVLSVSLCAVWNIDCPVPPDKTVCSVVSKDGNYIDRLVNVTYYNRTQQSFCGKFGCSVETIPAELYFTAISFEEVGSVNCQGAIVMGCVTQLSIDSYICEPCHLQPLVNLVEENLAVVVVEHVIIGLLCWVIIMLALLLFLNRCNKYCPAPESFH